MGSVESGDVTGFWVGYDEAARVLGVSLHDAAVLIQAEGVPYAGERCDLAALVQAYVAKLRATGRDPGRHPTQAEAGAHLDLSDRSIRELEGKLGLVGVDYTLDQIRIGYIRALREVAAGRAAEGDLDLATERARLAREQADKVAMQNAERRGELAPVSLMEQALAGAATRAVKILDTIRGEIRRQVPGLPASGLVAVDQIIAKALNTVAAMRLGQALDEDEDLDAPPSAAATDLTPVEGEP